MVNMDTRQFEQAAKALGRRFPQTVANAMHRTAEEARDRQRQQMHLSFTMRSASSARFAEQQVQVTERATASNLATTVALRGRGASLFGRHEKGGILYPPHGGDWYIPTEELRPFRQSNIPRGMYPKALGIDVRRTIVGSTGGRSKGKRRTFVIKSLRTPRSSGIYQRFGPRRGEIRLVWAFRPRITLEPRLKFVDTVTRVWRERLPVNFAGMLDVALRTGR